MSTDQAPKAEVRFVNLLESDLPKLICAGKLSNSTGFTLRVDGPFGKREARSLMHLLAVQMDVLSEPDRTEES